MAKDSAVTNDAEVDLIKGTATDPHTKAVSSTDRQYPRHLSMIFSAIATTLTMIALIYVPKGIYGVELLVISGTSAIRRSRPIP